MEKFTKLSRCFFLCGLSRNLGTYLGYGNCGLRSQAFKAEQLATKSCGMCTQLAQALNRPHLSLIKYQPSEMRRLHDAFATLLHSIGNNHPQTSDTSMM